MDLLRQLEVGRKTEKFIIHVKNEEALQFAKVVGEWPLQQIDNDTTQFIVPPTFPIKYWQEVEMPWLDGVGPLVHGEQSFQYDKPILTETTYYGDIQLVKVEEKDGKLGTVIWVEHELNGYDEDSWKPFFTCTTKAMFKEKTGEGR
ncbi:FAS1-like dehydratase domain-containing protein [Pseudalkalibacillus berkeleyi]|uniref:MaoC family dehydratase N-terminal domain-containing protein n=1 Tax=Pseudalkalibacillus berkeleyi TaxID=1069813 RepID=A0ABS9H3E2_9BACL|nr:MaoC family dehydratase N-terminal domain-containing protein [Pseudalkalibacillus berkeleyi]MCF6138378.1 MaoC family dehydratase N-terminal domain-containing protein [Pseudalkalibacillus berkeleyi]